MTDESAEVLTIWMDGSGYWVGALTCTSRTIYGLSVDRVRELGRSYVDGCFPNLPPGHVKLVERLEFRGLRQIDLSCFELDGHNPDDALGSDHFTLARWAIEAIATLGLPLRAELLAKWTAMSSNDVEQILRGARGSKVPLGDSGDVRESATTGLDEKEFQIREWAS